jgi:hypothetical protein
MTEREGSELFHNKGVTRNISENTRENICPKPMPHLFRNGMNLWLCVAKAKSDPEVRTS